MALYSLFGLNIESEIELLSPEGNGDIDVNIHYGSFDDITDSNKDGSGNGKLLFKATNPDFIYIPGYYQEVGLIIKQAREMGINAVVGGGDGWDSAKLPEIAGKAALNNTFFTNLYSPDDTSDLNKQFVADYQKKYNAKPDVFAALSYDCTTLIAKAIEDAKSADPAKIAEAMAKIKGAPGVSGEVTFDAQHNPIKSAVIIEFKDGKQTFKAKVNP